MKNLKAHVNRLKNDLKRLSSEKKAEANRRYFPNGVNSIGATALDIKSIISNFHSSQPELTENEVLSVTESLLQSSQFHEERLIAYGIMNKFVKKGYNDELLTRFKFWLEHYADNWAQVDDLCIKTIYLFLMARPHLIEKTQHWAYSEVSWCRRASSVVWVKFIKRRIGKSTYCLDKSLVFKNCDLLIEDDDEFVQKGVGWLLKATSIHHEQDVIEYIQNNHTKMTRPTIRYAFEKLDTQTRKRLLATTKPVN